MIKKCKSCEGTGIAYGSGDAFACYTCGGAGHVFWWTPKFKRLGMSYIRTRTVLTYILKPWRLF